jgi:uncharacterized protein YegP (UPF0339 family)
MTSYSGAIRQDDNGFWSFEIFNAEGKTVQLRQGYPSEEEAQAAMSFNIHELRVRDQHKPV